MAITVQDVNAFVNRFIVPRSTDVIYKRSPVFARLMKRTERFIGGTQISRPIIYNKLTAIPISAGDTFNVDVVPTDTELRVDLKAYVLNITLTAFDSMKDRGPLAVFTRVESKFQNATLAMAEALATDMYLDDDGARAKRLTGFKKWYDDGTNYAVVGGITRNDIYPIGSVGGLNAYTSTISGFTLRDLNRAMGGATWGPDRPDLIVVTQNGWDLIWEALMPDRRYVNDVGDLTEAGFNSFRFNNADVVVDQYLPTGSNGLMYGLNTKYIEWYVSDMPLFQFGFTGFTKFNNSLDVNGQFVFGGNIVVANPRTGFKLISNEF